MVHNSKIIRISEAFASNIGCISEMKINPHLQSVEAGKHETGSDIERNVGQGNWEGTWRC